MRGGTCQGSVRLLECPEEQSSVGVVCAIHADVSSEAAGDGRSDVREFAGNFEIWMPGEKSEEEQSRGLYNAANPVRTVSSAYRGMHAGRCSAVVLKTAEQHIQGRKLAEKEQADSSQGPGEKFGSASRSVCYLKGRPQ
jgi:hypothetical protein